MTKGIEKLLDRMSAWPESWMGVELDRAFGEALVEEMRPFMRHLAERGLAAKTLRRHLDNLWSIGAAVVRETDEKERREASPWELLQKAVVAGEAPLAYPLDEVVQKQLDATARKLWKWAQND